MPSGNTLVRPGKTKIVGTWDWLFTDAGAMLIMKYFQGCSRKSPIPVPAFDGTGRQNCSKEPVGTKVEFTKLWEHKGHFRKVGQRAEVI